MADASVFGAGGFSHGMRGHGKKTSSASSQHRFAAMEGTEEHRKLKGQEERSRRSKGVTRRSGFRVIYPRAGLDMTWVKHHVLGNKEAEIESAETKDISHS